MIKHNHRIKRLSTAIVHGYKMAQERGITQGTGTPFKVYRDKIYKACALGMVFLAVKGVRASMKVSEMDVYETIREHFNLESGMNIMDGIWDMNDNQRLTPLRIAKNLREIGK
jgi:hypothetical protein